MKARFNKTKRSLVAYSKKRKNVFLALTFIIVLVFSLLIVLPFSRNDSRASTTDLQNWINEFLSQYLNIVNENQPFDGISDNLTFFWNTPNEIECVVSSSHGAVVFFDHAKGNTRSITVKEFSKSIEYYIYPQMSANITRLPSVRVLKGVYILTSRINIPQGLFYVDPEVVLRYTGQGHAFNVSENGAILIFGELIEGDRLILKGSNNKEDWSTLQARFDALDQFVWDCRSLNSTKIANIENKHEMTFLLERISSRMETGEYRDNPSLFTQDFEKLKETGASNETLSAILLQYYENQKTPPSWLESIWNFFIQTIVGQLLIVTIKGQ